MITFSELPALNGSKHTIIGRLLKGKDTMSIIENAEEYKLASSTFDISNITGALGESKLPELPVPKEIKNLNTDES